MIYKCPTTNSFNIALVKFNFYLTTELHTIYCHFSCRPERITLEEMNEWLRTIQFSVFLSFAYKINIFLSLATTCFDAIESQFERKIQLFVIEMTSIHMFPYSKIRF